MFRQILAVVGDLREFLALDVIQCMGQRHFPAMAMVAKCLAVRGNVHEFRSRAVVGEFPSELYILHWVVPLGRRSPVVLD
jgi:hypothetical protein